MAAAAVLTAPRVKWNLMTQNDCFGRVERQLHIYRKHLFGFTRPSTTKHGLFELLAAAFSGGGFMFSPRLSSNQANVYGSLRMKRLKVKFTGRLKLSDYPCYGNLTNRKSERVWLLPQSGFKKNVNECGRANTCTMHHNIFTAFTFRGH